MNPILLLGAALLATKFAGQGSAAKQLQFSPNGVGIKDGKLTVSMNVTNPAGTSINVDEAFLQIFIDDTAIGNINIVKGKGFTITKRGTTLVSLPIKLNAVGTIKFAAAEVRKFKASKSSAIPEKVTIKGNIVSMGVPFPINETVPLSL